MATRPGDGRDKRARGIAGTALILIIGLLTAGALGRFFGYFEPTVPITVYTDRVGLVMDDGSKVRARGVDIGQVSDIRREENVSVIDLKVNPELLRSVPSNATVHIGSNTVFGAKGVTFEIPDNPSPTPMERDTVIGEATVTSEVNSMFEQLTDLLQSIRPDQLNATLGAVSNGLSGRGETLGDTIHDLNQSLQALNPNLDTLERDLDKSAQVSNIYADASDDLMRLLDSGTDVGQTVVQRQQQFEALLANAIGTADTGNVLLRENGDDIIKTLRDLRATTSLVAEYSPALNCMIIGLNQGVEEHGQVFGGKNQAGLVFKAGFQQGAKPYEYPKDLPKVNASTGPRCHGMPNMEPGTKANFLVSDTGSNVVEGMPNSFRDPVGPLIGPAIEAEPGKPAPPAILQLMLGQTKQYSNEDELNAAVGNPAPDADAPAPEPVPTPEPAPADGGER